MARIARTHKETVRPNFEKVERPDLSKEVEGTSANPGGKGSKLLKKLRR